MLGFRRSLLATGAVLGLATAALSAVSGPVYNTYRQVGITGQQANKTWTTNATKNYQLYRHYDRIMADCDRLTVWWGQWCQQSNTEVSTGLATYNIVRVSVEIPGAPTPVVALTFSGGRTKAITTGQDLITADELTPAAFGLAKFSADTPIFIKGIGFTTGTVTDTTRDRGLYNGAGFTFPVTGTIYGYYQSPGDNTDVNQVDTAGAWNIGAITTGGGAVPAAIHVPTGIIGRTTASQVSLIAIVDSVGDGYQAFNFDSTNGYGGFVRQAAWNKKLPLFMHGTFGSVISAFGGTRSTALIQAQYGSSRIFSAGLQQTITNDAGLGLAAMQSASQTLWGVIADAANGARPVYACNVLYTSQSTSDGNTSYAGQTQFSPGQTTVLEAYNTWLSTKVGDGTIVAQLPYAWYSSGNSNKLTVPGKTFITVGSNGAGATTIRITGTTAPVVGEGLAFPASNMADAFIVATVGVVNGTTWDVTKYNTVNTQLDLPNTFAAHAGSVAVAASGSPLDNIHQVQAYHALQATSLSGVGPF